MAEEVLARIRELAEQRELLERSPIAPQELVGTHRLIEDLLLDSIELLSLAVEVENEFEVAFSEEDDASIRTIEDLVRTVCRYRDPAPSEREQRSRPPGSAAR